MAIYIKGKSDYENDDYISEEVNTFILHALKEINEKFDIDFRQEIDLRISLALHLMPLLTRIEYNIQNENQLLDQIKQSFPLGFDIAAYMCLLLQNSIDKKLKKVRLPISRFTSINIWLNTMTFLGKKNFDHHKLETQ